MGDKADRYDKDRHDRDKPEKEKRDKQQLEFAGTAERDVVAEYLNRLADGIRLGAVTLTSSGQSVHLESPQRLRLEVEARHRPDKGSSSIQLEISWKAERPAREEDEERLTIEPARPGSTARATTSVSERP